MATSASPVARALGWTEDLGDAGADGFVIRSAAVEGKLFTVIASRTEVGTLYGAFHLLRIIQTERPTNRFDLAQRPKLRLRLLKHWDNLDGSIERGYAGHSLWRWDELPEATSPGYVDYARANASLGINGTVLNNVNASPRILLPAYLRKVAALADVFRPYGLRVYLSVNFASPMLTGALPTNDPLDPAVIAWWA